MRPIWNRIKNLREKDGEKKKKAEGKLKAFIKAKFSSVVVLFLLKILPIFIGVALAYLAVSWVADLFDSVNNPQYLYETIGKEDLNELITVAGNEEDGYYLAYKQGLDEKLDEIVERYKKAGYQNIDKEILLKLIQAELYTQYPDLGGKVGHEADVEIGESGTATFSGGIMNIPLIYQVRGTSCGPTSVAMVLSYLTGTTVTEDDVYNWCTQPEYGQTYFNGIGSNGPLFSAAAEHWGVGSATITSDVNAVRDALLSGKPVIAHVSAGAEHLFTDGDHFIVLTGIDDEGKVHVNNPNSGKHSDRGYDIDTELNVVAKEYYIYEYGARVSITDLEGFLFIGDSITDLMDEYGVADVTCTFRAKVSARTDYWIEHFSELPEDSENVKGINVMLGTNGYAWDANCLSNMEKLLEKLHEKYPSKVIFVDKILPDKSYGYSDEKRDQYNKDLEAYCEGKSYLVFIDPTSGVEIGSDGCHPTVDGTKTLWNNIKNEVKNSGSSSSDSVPPLIIAEDTGEGTEGFQGGIRIRRVMPNKEIGVLANTSSGQASSTGSIEGAIAGDITDYLSQNSNDGRWSVYAKNLKTQTEKTKINSNYQMQSASLIKLFVMATAYQEMEQNNVSIDKGLIEIMITKSDNDATNTIITTLGNGNAEQGMNKINSYAQEHGYEQTEIHRLMLHAAVNGDNYTSTSDVAKILEEIYNGKCVSKTASDEMLGYLKAQTRTTKIPAGVPDNVVTANKTGELSDVENDAAIVYKEGAPYILVVMSSGLSDTAKARSNIVQISKIVYEQIDQKDDNEQNDNGQSENSSETKEQHVVAVVAGHGDDEGANQGWYETGTEDTTGVTDPAWKEKDITLKVANYVKQIFENKYPQFKIVTDGYSKKNEDRLKIAKDAGAEMFIGVHFNSDNSSSMKGTGVYYEAGTDYVKETKELAEDLQATIMEELGTTKGEGVTSKNSYTAFNNGRQNEFGGPALYVEGAYMSNKEDMQIIAKDNEEGLKNYAKGIVAGILKYYGVENEGYGDLDNNNTTTSQSETVSTTINSKVFDLQYIPESKFNQLIANKDEKVLEYYTLNGSWELIVATWSYSSEEGVTFSKNTQSINYRTALQNYITPFEYLLDYYIDIKEEDFIKAFADLVLDSEFIIAVQDNVTTTKVTTTKTVEFTDKDGKTNNYTDTEEKITENVSQQIEVTYVDTWFVKFAKTSSYSAAALQSSGGSLTGEQGEYIGEYQLTSYCYVCNDDGSGNMGTAITASGRNATVNRTVAIHNAASGGDPNGLQLGDQIMFDGHVYVVEDTGRGKPGAWLDVYVNPTSNVYGQCCINSEFADRTVSVYRANSVTESSGDDLAGADNKSSLNVVTNVMGETTENASYTSQSYNESSEDGTSLITLTTETRMVSAKYVTGDVEISGNEKKFLKLFEDYPEALSRLKPKWLITIVNKGRTAKFSDLTKYLLYKLTGDSYGVTNFNFNIYEPGSFSSIRGGGYTFTGADSILWRNNYSKEDFVNWMQNNISISAENQKGWDTFFKSRAGDWYDICTTEGIDPMVMVCIGMLESGFGNSRIAWDKGNLWGWGAVDSNPYGGAASHVSSTGTISDAAMSLLGTICQSLKQTADNPFSGMRYDIAVQNGAVNPDLSTIYGTGYWYCSDHEGWIQKVTSLMKTYFGDFVAKYCTGGGDVLSACEDVARVWRSRNVHYSLVNLPATPQEAYESAPYACCATYVCTVLYRAGLLTQEQITPYSWHYTGDGGIPNLLANAGWTRVDPSQKQPGDVINNHGIHVAIYAGDGLIYDQHCGVISSSGNPPISGPFASSYATNNTYQVWRAP